MHSIILNMSGIPKSIRSCILYLGWYNVREILWDNGLKNFVEDT